MLNFQCSSEMYFVWLVYFFEVYGLEDFVVCCPWSVVRGLSSALKCMGWKSSLSVVRGQLSVVCCPWSVVSFEVYGLEEFVVSCPWSVVSFEVYGLEDFVVSCPWSVVSRPSSSSCF
jgi:hypothetical protein